MTFSLSLLFLLLALIELDRCRRRRAPEAAWFAAFCASVALWIWTHHPLVMVSSISLLAAAWVARRPRSRLDPRHDEPRTDALFADGSAELDLDEDPGPSEFDDENEDSWPDPRTPAGPDEVLLASMPARAARLEGWIAEQGAALADGPEGLAQLDALLQVTLAHCREPDRDELLADFGAYLGERIRREEGGQWEEDPEFGLCLAGLRGSPVRAFPLAKVRARLGDPGNDSLIRYRQTLDEMIEESLRQPS